LANALRRTAEHGLPGALGLYCTVSMMVVVLVKLPDVPVMITGMVPTAAVLATLNVTVLVVVVPVGLNDAVTPAGSPPALRLTYPAKLLTPRTEIVLSPLEPLVTFKLLAEADNE